MHAINVHNFKIEKKGEVKLTSVWSLDKAI